MWGCLRIPFASVLIDDLGALSVRRWPAYAPAAQDHGLEAVFAFPLQLGNSCLGVLDIYRNRRGKLSPDAFDDASTFARLAFFALLDEHEMVTSWLAGEDGTNAYDPRNNPLVVHQAVGFVMAQLDVAADEAILRLRAHVFASNRPISQVAEDIVVHRLVLGRDVM